MNNEHRSETAKQRNEVVVFCDGAGLDIASNGDPVVPWAWQLELSDEDRKQYSAEPNFLGPVQLRGRGESLPVDSNSLDWVYSSHLLEDYLDWEPVLREWVRVIKPGGFLIVLVPDKELWAAALANGQPPNCSHKHEATVGELSTYAQRLGVEVIEDRLTNSYPGDYTILFVARKFLLT